MKRITLTILFLNVVLSFQASSQKLSQEYGVVAADDISYTYDKDPDALAVVLFDHGESKFVRKSSGGFELLFTRKTRIKVLKKGGKQYGDVGIFFRKYKDGREFVEKIKGTTYNIENGRLTRTELDPKQVYEENGLEYRNYKKFAMPEVNEGSIFEYSYQIRSPYFFFFRDWNFQNFIPTVSSKYTAKMVPFYSYSFIMQEIDTVDHIDEYIENSVSKLFQGVEYKDKVYEFEMNNVPAFKRDEKFITSEYDYLKKMKFQLFRVTQSDGTKKDYSTTWEKMVKEADKETPYGKYIDAAERRGKKILSSELTGLEGLSERKKFDVIINYVKENLSWNGYYSRGASISIGELLKVKTGSTAEINLFAIGLLRAAGFSAFQVMNSTRDHGRIFYDQPFYSFFNNSIGVVKIDGNNYFFDTSEPRLSNYLIPANCLNENGLKMEKDNPVWLALASPFTSVKEKRIYIQPDLNIDSLKLSVNASYSHYDAFELKDKCKDSPKCLSEAFNDRGYTLKKTPSSSGYDEKELPYRVKFGAAVPMTRFNDKLIINPLLNEGISKNYLTAETREYPVDFNYKKKRVYSSIVIVPKDYEALSLPEDVSLSNNLIDFSYSVKSLNGSIQVATQYEFKKSKYPKEDYQELKKAYKTVFDKLKEEIVLVKK